MSKKIEWVDGLKGFGCTSVVFLHLLACLFPKAQNGANEYIYGGVYNYIQLTPINILFNGSFFVYIFWTLSAYLLTKAINNANDIFPRLRRKYFRLFLLAIIVSIPAFILLKCGLYYYDRAGSLIENSFWTNERDYSQFFLVDLLRELVWNDWFGSSYIIPPFWTMRYEILGSIIISTLIACDCTNNRKLIAFIILIIMGTNLIPYLCFFNGMILASKDFKISPHISFFCFFIGVLLGAYPPTGIPVAGMYNKVYIFFVVSYNKVFDTLYGVHFMYVVASAMIILGVINNDLLRNFFGGDCLKTSF